ncbi:DUF3600 domain-containing protein [Paenibacillus sp. XY044]|uniref:DUF3600 domain-containing protein n=1 Tax=Paenibacillus sp. XY044 TaxID=2026089 RepID=UPI000B99CB3F|nr:DUF3600 domain-containing protein [Paenibacillus sp. XY044]OZB96170.1 hypothetical protein CJP46_09675 [Paenibacillus sp. XY044]
MSLDERLKTAFTEETKDWNVPADLKGKILNRVVTHQPGRRMKKWIAAGILTAALLIPTGAYAGYSYLADSIYGSQENIAKYGVGQEQYAELEAKLQSAKQNLSEEEFTKWLPLLKELGTMNMKIADANGDIHPDRLSADEQKQYNSLLSELEPIFSKLNEIQSSPKREVKMADNAAFWGGIVDQARLAFSKEEFDEFQKLIDELKAYDAKTLDPDGSVHLERISVEDESNIDRVTEQLQPYFKKLGITVKP